MDYQVRSLKGYAITASELRTVGTLNSISALFVAIASLATGVWFGVWWDVTKTPGDAVVQNVGETVMSIAKWLAVACYLIAAAFFLARRAEMKHILAESGVPPRSLRATVKACWNWLVG